MSATVEWVLAVKADDEVEAPATDTRRGLPVESLSLSAQDRTQSDVALPTARSRDARLEEVEGDRFLDPRRKKRSVVLAAQLTQDQINVLARWREDSRPVWFNSNFDQNTVLSVPMVGSLDSISGPDLTDLAPVRYAWDPDRQVLDRFEGDACPYGGPYGRYGRPDSTGEGNHATTRHPTSASPGWTVKAGGAGTVTYDDDIPSVVLSQRHTTNEKGCTVLKSNGSTITTFTTPAAGLASGSDIAATLYIRNTTTCIVSLVKADGSTADSVVIGTDVSAGRWVQAKLSGAQSAGGTTATVEILHTVSSSRAQVSIVSAILIANGTLTGRRVLDWLDSSANAPASLVGSVGEYIDSGALTLSCLFKLPADPIEGAGLTGQVGLFELGVSPNCLFYYDVTNDVLTFDPTGADAVTCKPITDGDDIAVGDWVHAVAVVEGSLTSALIDIWVNGNLMTSGSVSAVNGNTNIGKLKALGTGGPSPSHCDSTTGMMLARIDRVAWSDSQIQRHYLTYGQNIGQTIVQDTMGRTFELARMDVEQFSVDRDGTIFSVGIRLDELEEFEEFTPISRTGVYL